MIYIEVVAESFQNVEHIISILTHKECLILLLQDCSATFLFIGCPQDDGGIWSLTFCRCLTLPKTRWPICQGFTRLLKASSTSLWWTGSQISFFLRRFPPDWDWCADRTLVLSSSLGRDDLCLPKLKAFLCASKCSCFMQDLLASLSFLKT